MNLSQKLGRLSIWSAGLIGVLLMIPLWGSWVSMILLWVIGIPLLAVIFLFLSGMVCGFAGEEVNLLEGIEEPESLEYDPQIYEVGPRVGTLAGNPIYEYVCIKGRDNNFIKCEFSSVLDWNEDHSLNEGRHFVMLYNVLYIEPEETDASQQQPNQSSNSSGSSAAAI